MYSISILLKDDARIDTYDDYDDRHDDQSFDDDGETTKIIITDGPYCFVYLGLQQSGTVPGGTWDSTDPSTTTTAPFTGYST